MADLERFLVVNPNNLFVATTASNQVIVQLRGIEDAIQLPERTGLAIQLSPAEARLLASHLNRTADEAEGKLPRA